MYKPNPIDTSDITLGDQFYALMERLAEQVHEVWAKGRVDDGWTYGESRDDEKNKPRVLCRIPSFLKMRKNTIVIPQSKP